MDLRLTTVATFLTPEDAEVARLALEEADIAIAYENATIVGMVWYWGNAVGWVKLQVPEINALRARDILDQAIGRLETSGPIQSCPSCGVRVPAEFSVCWSCQKDLSEDAVNRDGNHLSSSAENEVWDEVLETDAGDAMAWRALLAALIGTICCPPAITLYSGWLLLRLSFAELPLSNTGKKHCRWAIIFDLIACLFVGFFIAF